MKDAAKFALIKKRINITNEEIAEHFGYSSPDSLKNSSKFPTLRAGLIWFYEKCGDQFDLPEKPKK